MRWTFLRTKKTSRTSGRVGRRDTGCAHSELSFITAGVGSLIRPLHSANNQWKLKEEIPEGLPLEKTSFYRALQLSRGTVSVLDPKVGSVC